MDKDAKPSRSASATAVLSTRSRLRGALGWVAAFMSSVCPPSRFVQCTDSVGRTPYEPRLEERHMPSRNPAARAGRWSATHRKAAILGWIAFVVLATVLGGKVGQKDLDASARGSGESKRGDLIVKAAGFPKRAGEQVLVQGRGGARAGD